MRKLCVFGCLYLSSYQQAQSGVKIGLRKLEELGIATTRPEDYFAEMVKTDDHMRKVSCVKCPLLLHAQICLMFTKGTREVAESSKGSGAERESQET